jgi:Rad3-related DNA helicase
MPVPSRRAWTLPPPGLLDLPAKFATYHRSQVEAFYDITMSEKRFRICSMPTGCHAAGTLVVMMDGALRRVEDICVGDVLLGPDSTPRRVLRLHRGRQPMYQVTPVKGESFVVNQDHLLSVVVMQQSASSTFPSEQRRVETTTPARWVNSTEWYRHCRKLRRSGAVVFETEPQLPIDPYFLGVLLGDGSLERSISVCTPDPEIVSCIYEQAAVWDLDVRTVQKPNNKATDYYMAHTRNADGTHTPRRVNMLMQAVDSLGLRVGCEEKRVPDAYRTASVEDRLQMLAGLLDTDGHQAHGGFEIICKGAGLRDDIVFLARSLGLAAYVSTKTAPKICDTIYWRIKISGDCSVIPTRIPRKRAPVRQQIKDVLCTGFDVQKVAEDGEYFGFELDRDHLYMTSDFTIHHNSGKSLLPYLVATLEQKRVLVVTSTKALQDQYRNDFLNLSVDVRGASNYRCAALEPGGQYADLSGRRGLSPTCDNGPCKLGMACELKKAGCELYDRIRLANGAEIVVTNYSKWLADGRQLLFSQSDEVVETLGTFDYLFLDEFHHAATHVEDAMSIELQPKTVRDLLHVDMPPDTLSTDQFRAWATQSRLIVAEKLAECGYELRASREDGVVRGELLAEVTDLKRLDRTLLEIAAMRGAWVVENQGRRGYRFDPVVGAPYAESILFRGVENIVGMSATVRPATMRYHSVAVDQFDFFEYPSSFPVANRPIYFLLGGARLHFKATDSDYRIWAASIDNIRRTRGDRNGLVHTVSYGRAKMYKDLSRYKDDVVTHVSTTTGRTVEEFKDFPRRGVYGKLLVSPVIDTGYDFLDQSAEYNVIGKCPYPSTESKVMRARVDADPGYRDFYAAEKMVQMSGRVVRAEWDRGETFIVDTAAGGLLKRTELFPRYFLQALQYVRVVPEPLPKLKRRG